MQFFQVPMFVVAAYVVRREPLFWPYMFDSKGEGHSGIAAEL